MATRRVLTLTRRAAALSPETERSVPSRAAAASDSPSRRKTPAEVSAERTMPRSASETPPLAARSQRIAAREQLQPGRAAAGPAAAEPSSGRRASYAPRPSVLDLFGLPHGFDGFVDRGEDCGLQRGDARRC